MQRSRKSSSLSPSSGSMSAWLTVLSSIGFLHSHEGQPRILDVLDGPAFGMQAIERLRHFHSGVRKVVPDDDAGTSDQSACEPALVQHRELAVIAVDEHGVAGLKVPRAQQFR